MLAKLGPLTATALTALALLTACGSDDEPSAATDPSQCSYPQDGKVEDPTLPPGDPTVTGDVAATLSLSQGEVPLTLHAGDSPCTVSSFLTLAEAGYFDDTICHRLTTSGIYVLQCGDPTGTGGGGPGYSFADELDSAKALESFEQAPDYKIYPPGTLAMANAGANTNGSQFFLVYEDSPLLPNYTVFGTIDPAGLDVLTAIAEAGTSDASTDGAPNEPVTITGVTVS
jgi:peptidyl-prolyl cis-trans isomerase B (cyclophilin B)